MRLNGIIFDLDGTLADTMDLSCSAFQHVFQSLAHRVFTPQEVFAMFGQDEEGIIRSVLPDQWQEALQLHLDFYEDEHDSRVLPIPHVLDLLDWLAASGLKVGLVTGKGTRAAGITIRKLGLEHYLDAIETGFPQRLDKPTCIRRILDCWGEKACEVAYVGDIPYDMRASIDAGTVPIGAAWTTGADVPSLRAAGAFEVFTSPQALQMWLADQATSSS
jgi:pyrophosphatase PpaX